jgi:putative acetyltransferase
MARVAIRLSIMECVLIRPETSDDQAAITRVNNAAFGGDNEARLVDRLREARLLVASLVAVDESGQAIGHIAFSPVTILAGGDERQVASLAPMAVVPSHQRQGIGSMLVDRGLQACRHAGYRAVIVVGHPDYYPRFGFSHALVEGLENPFGAGTAFMGLELARGSLSSLGGGRVVYPEVLKQVHGHQGS